MNSYALSACEYVREFCCLNSIKVMCLDREMTFRSVDVDSSLLTQFDVIIRFKLARTVLATCSSAAGKEWDREGRTCGR